MGSQWSLAFSKATRKIKNYGPNLLRPFGLRIIAATRRDEPRKIVVYNSLWAAWCRSLIHIVPTIISISLCVVNLQGRFIGRELEGPSGNEEAKVFAIQIAAKVQVSMSARAPSQLLPNLDQELLMMTSLGSIILHLLRHKMLRGSGVPLGLIGSDKACTQPTCVLGPDLL